MTHLIFHNEFDSSISTQEQELHPLLTNPPYTLSLSINELITPKEKKITTSRNKNKVNKKGAKIVAVESDKSNRAKDKPCDNAVPRPHNAFIIFRTDFAERVKNIYHPERVSIRLISKLASITWKGESSTVRSFFQILADMYLQRHKIKYPDYKYTPIRKDSSDTIKRNRKIKSKQEKPSKKPKRDESKELLKEHMFTWNVNEKPDSLALSSVSLSSIDINDDTNLNKVYNAINNKYPPENDKPLAFINYTAPSLLPNTTTTSPLPAPPVPPTNTNNYYYLSQYENIIPVEPQENISLESILNTYSNSPLPEDFLSFLENQPNWNQ
ncbi:7541_t:CDS:1 [Funneliformis mosseae]|uniref:7541_t:CDS:1 n=1 Tax=Funneliformis mosseae TaxID=27381 RepID=A0A9N9FQM0_FUNMO|nr:7541_t:CDS:1 [Funneliformis mosseae]